MVAHRSIDLLFSVGKTDVLASELMRHKLALGLIERLRMKFSQFSDEETCSSIVKRENNDLICMRTKGHIGDHIPEAGKAGEADGVRFCCRVKLEGTHTDWCVLNPLTKVLSFLKICGE